MSACLSSYFKVFSQCCPRPSSARRSTSALHNTYHFFCSHSLIPIEPFFCILLLSSFFLSSSLVRWLVCKCRYTVVVCFHLVIYNFVNLMLSRLCVPCSHSTTHKATQKHNRSERPTMHCQCWLLPSYRSCFSTLLSRHKHTPPPTAATEKKTMNKKKKKC